MTEFWIFSDNYYDVVKHCLYNITINTFYTYKRLFILFSLLLKDCAYKLNSNKYNEEKEKKTIDMNSNTA